MEAESKIEKAVKKYAQEKGFYVRKFRSPSQRGVPDSLFICPMGDVFFIEFKAPTKEPTPLQLREARLIEKNHGRVYFVDNKQRGIEIIESFLLF